MVRTIAEPTTLYVCSLGSVADGYDLFANKDEIEVDFLLMGPGCTTEAESQAKANKLISIANERKDCIACISPQEIML